MQRAFIVAQIAAQLHIARGKALPRLRNFSFKSIENDLQDANIIVTEAEMNHSTAEYGVKAKKPKVKKGV